ncbi:MAG: hypothetical protein JOZ43_07795, partial [Acidobacteriales bacterium]|nr:hypothetical protein [Terriglobales bacterium]
LATDAAYLRFAGLARMDMIAATFGIAGVAAYSHWREGNLRRALLLSNCCVAACCMTHPMGGMFLFCLAALTLAYDRKRLQWREYALALAPYVVALVLWGVYIARDPAMFHSQFGGNVNGVLAEIGGTRRFDLLAHPLSAVRLEWRHRIASAYHRAYTPVLYVVALAVFSVQALRNRNKERLLLAFFALLCVGILTWFDGLKEPSYVLYYVPWLAAVLAVLSVDVARRSKPAATIAVVVLCGFIGAQQREFWRSSLRTTQMQQYLAAANYVKAKVGNHGSILGSAEICYDLGFRPELHDDLRLGYYTGRTPDLIVASARYENWLTLPAPDPARDFARNRLASEYKLTFQNAYYKIYERR